MSSKTREGMGGSTVYKDYEGSGLEMALRDQARLEMKNIIMKKLTERLKKSLIQHFVIMFCTF